MEVGVRLIGIVLRILDFLLSPFFWLKGRNRRTVPPIRNPLLLLSAKELADAVRTGEHTSEEIVSAYIERVKEVNPYLNAVVDERYRAALDEARAVDRQVDEARSNGTLDDLVKEKPLLGVPFTVKESCSLGGMSNSVGVLENAGSRALRDGHAVSLVREAGAIPLLVSSTPELCLGWETSNLIRGVTNNPHDLGRTPAGSSGGEAALLACGASPLSVSSDIAGSIRLPAAFTGVVGHKPTPGIVSIDLHVPTLSDEQFPRLLTVGPAARFVQDVELLLTVLAGERRQRLRLDTPVHMNDLKIFYMVEAGKSPALIPVEKCIQKAILDVVKYLKETCGCTVSEEKFPELEDSVEISCSVFFSMKDIPNMLQDPADPKRSRSLCGEVFRHVCGGARRSLQALGFELLRRTRLFIPTHRHTHYTTHAHTLTDHFTKVLGENGVFIYPVFNELAHYHNQVFVKASGVMYTMVFNVCGLPATAVPVCTHRGLPVAVQIIAGPNQDRLCLAVAREIERGFGGWRPPHSPTRHHVHHHHNTSDDTRTMYSSKLTYISK